MRLVFLGTPAVAVPCLEALLSAGHEVPLVVCQPDRPVGRSRKPAAPPVKRAALAHGLEIFQPPKVRNAAFRERLAAVEPDVLAVVAYGRILTAKVLEIAPHGAVNVHFSLLPAYRGAAPVQWSLARGEVVTGVTTMQMDERLDEGPILLRESLDILEGERAGELAGRLAVRGAKLLVTTLDGLADGTLEAQPQDHSIATFAPLLTRSDGDLKLSMTATEVAGRVRGFDPWPGVWARVRGKRVRLLQASVLPPAPGNLTEESGTVVGADASGLIVALGGDTRLRIETVQFEGRKPIGAVDACNGRMIVPGDRLEAPTAAD